MRSTQFQTLTLAPSHDNRWCMKNLLIRGGLILEEKNFSKCVDITCVGQSQFLVVGRGLEGESASIGRAAVQVQSCEPPVTADSNC